MEFRFKIKNIIKKYKKFVKFWSLSNYASGLLTINDKINLKKIPINQT